MISVVHINASYKPAFIYGGPTMSVSALCEMLSAHSFCNIEVFTTTADGDNELDVQVDKQQIVDNVKVTYFKRWTKDHTHFSPSLLLHFYKNAKRFDVVHIHAWWNLVSMLCCAIAVLKGKKVALSPRGTLSGYSFINRNSSVKSLIHRFVGNPLLKKTHFVVTSEKEKKDILNIVHPTSIYIAHNLVNFPPTAPAKDRSTIGPLQLLFLSRVEQKKGLELLFHALSNIKFDYALTIVGTGESDYVKELQNLLNSLGIQEKINWAGGIYGDEKFKVLASHDLLILPSYDENFANVVIESLAMGTPVLLSEMVGLASYVEENSLGWISKVNALSIQEKLIEIHQNRDKLSDMSKRSIGIIQRDFDKKTLAEKHIEIYNAILKNGK